MANLDAEHKIQMISKRDPDVLQKYISDPDIKVRCAVAKYGDIRELNILVKDSCADVRVAVAKRGIGRYLDRLSIDKSPYVRAVVAETGGMSYMSRMINDRSHVVKNVIESFNVIEDTFYDDEDNWV